MIVRVPHIPKAGETVLGSKFSTAAGGKGANQAVAAARAGGNVTFVARLGTDDFANHTLADLEKDNINTDFVVRDKNAPSGVAQIMVADNGENCIAVASGANNSLSPDDVSRAEKEIAESKILLLQLEIPVETVKQTILLGKKLGVPTILNPAPAAFFDRNVLSDVSIITPNEHEAALLSGIEISGKSSAQKAANKLHNFGIAVVIITLGANGVCVVSEKCNKFFPAFNVTAVDTTAAGDVFNGVLAVFLAEGKELEEAVLFANAASALSVQKAGAQPSIPFRKDIEQFGPF